jgi:hypothetical protein
MKVDTSDEAFDPEGSTTMAKVYKIRWKVRSEKIKQVVLKEAADAHKTGYMLRGTKVCEDGVELQDF